MISRTFMARPRLAWLRRGPGSSPRLRGGPSRRSVSAHSGHDPFFNAVWSQELSVPQPSFSVRRYFIVPP
jgi:hypothetical protein